MPASEGRPFQFVLLVLLVSLGFVAPLFAALNALYAFAHDRAVVRQTVARVAATAAPALAAGYIPALEAAAMRDSSFDGVTRGVTFYRPGGGALVPADAPPQPDFVAAAFQNGGARTPVAIAGAEHVFTVYVPVRAGVVGIAISRDRLSELDDRAREWTLPLSWTLCVLLFGAVLRVNGRPADNSSAARARAGG